MQRFESATAMSEISILQIDYLAEIYQAVHIENLTSGEWVSSAELAERMAISQSTVNRVIEQLREKNLIEHQRYVGVQLTTEGIPYAKQVLHKQAIIESFLSLKMGFAWQDVYQEARAIRHGVNDLIIQRMWDLAGNPTISPFGDPINTEGARLEEILLTDAAIKQAYRIARILTRQKDRLNYLAALGLVPQTALHLVHKAPFDGPLQIRLGGEYRILGHQLARKITVVHNP